MNSKERCLSVLRGEKPDFIPVFPLLMFFSQKRSGVNYKTFATNGHALAEAQLQIRDKFSVDAITACSDAFRITADLGAEMMHPDDSPPYAVTPLIKTEGDLNRLRKPDCSNLKTRMYDRVIAVREMVKSAGEECLVAGWVDMPFAEACSVCGITEFMTMIVDNPEMAHKILLFLTDIVIDFSLIQLQAGAPIIGAGDAAASLISSGLYEEFVLPYEQKVCAAVHTNSGLVKLHICGNTAHLMKKMTACGADLFNVDHMVDLAEAKNVYTAKNLAFKGNLNPVNDFLHSTPEKCEQKTMECMKKTEGSRYMLSAGCEIPADTSDEVFSAFCNSPRKINIPLADDTTNS